MNKYGFGATRILLTLFALLPLSQAALYPYGIENGDQLLTDEFVEFSIGYLRFLGPGTTNGLWVNEGGSLTFRKLQDPRFDQLLLNAAISPFFAQSAPNATIYYRQVTNEPVLFDTIAQDVQTSDLLPELPNAVTLKSDFVPTWALIVTWSELASPDDPLKTNTFQVAIVSNGEQTFAIYNYEEPLQWWTSDNSYAYAGLFVAGEEMLSCSVVLEGSETESVKDIYTKSNVPTKEGRFVMIVSEPFLCQTAFASACGGLPDERSRWGSTQFYFEHTLNPDENWQFYALFTCDEGFHLSEGVRSEKMTCKYDSDYYDASWTQGSNAKCIDMGATRQFDVKTILSSINGQEIEWRMEMSDPDSTVFKEMQELVEDAFKDVLEGSGIVDVSVRLIRARRLQRRDGEPYVEMEISVKLPPYIQKKMNSTRLQEKIDETLSKDNIHKEVEFYPFSEVDESTDNCLQACLCRNRKSIDQCPRNSTRTFETDACCGGCNGHAYATGIKACCVDRIYDPTKSLCCNGRIKNKEKWPSCSS